MPIGYEECGGRGDEGGGGWSQSEKAKKLRTNYDNDNDNDDDNDKIIVFNMIITVHFFFLRGDLLLPLTLAAICDSVNSNLVSRFSLLPVERPVSLSLAPSGRVGENPGNEVEWTPAGAFSEKKTRRWERKLFSSQVTIWEDLSRAFMIMISEGTVQLLVVD